MLRRLIIDWRAWRSARAGTRHPGLVSVFRQTRAALAASVPAADYEAQLRTCLAEAVAVLAAPQPIPAVRRALFALLPMAARVAVVASTPDWRLFSRYLSGDLGRHVAELAGRDPELAACLQGAAPDACHARFQRRLANLDRVRRSLGDGDADPGRDWLAPAWISACIFREDVYRGALGLPGLLPPARAMYCSGWQELAEAGERHLRPLWEAGWQEAFGEPSPFCGWDGSAGFAAVSAPAGAGGAPSRLPAR